MKKYNITVKISTLSVLAFLIIYCSQLTAAMHPKHLQPTKPIATTQVGSIISNFNNIDNIKHQKLVFYYVRIYSRGNQLYKLIHRSKYYFRHIITELKKRNLPSELALLPIVESTYRPFAISNKGAYGLWQISYATGKRYGLIYNKQDSRTDLTASTNAALIYLNFLYQKFDHNWLLALAAYNAGEGRISKAIKHNQLAGKNTDYWHLHLPKETKHFVPKLLALSIIFNNPHLFGLGNLITNNNYY